MDVEQVFKHKFEQSYRILSDMDVLRLLDLAAHLRHMLLEGLVDQVNKEYRLKIVYDVGPVSGEILWGVDLHINGEPVVSYGDHPVIPNCPGEVPIDGLLKYEILAYRGCKYSVKDVVLVCSNKLGGVHLDMAIKDSDRYAALAELERSTKIGPIPAVWRSLGVVGRIALEGLAPLYARVR